MWLHLLCVMYQSSKQFLTNVFVLLLLILITKRKHLLIVNNQTEQLLLTFFCITFKGYWYLTNKHELAQISLFFLGFFFLPINLICMLDFTATKEKKSTYQFSTWAMHFKSVIKILPSLLLCLFMIFKTKASVKNNLSAEKLLHSNYISTHCHLDLFKTLLTGIP